MAKKAKRTYPAKELGLQKRLLPHSIVEVVNTLQKAGFEAYIVGGGVRDGLLGLMPKDFDAVTNARPHEVKSVFGGRCRIIGKRFQLAHVYSGRELIEVATFRAPPKDDTHTTDDGMITRDNVWGDIFQDFERRDFSINALYYDPIKDVVLDFCGAINDIKSQKLRLLGNAQKRIEEDPVRLLRALRFKAKLGFEFDKALAKQFNDNNWLLLDQVSAHRLYDETQKMFTGGYLAPLLPLLCQYGAMNCLMNHAPVKPTSLMAWVAQNSDERVAGGRTVNPAYFYAVLLWENYLHHLEKFKKKHNFYDAQTKAIARVFEHQRGYTAIPKFAEDFIADIWLMQPKLVSPKPSDILPLATHPKFRAGYDFLLAREQADDCALSEPTNKMGAWWTQFMVFDDKARQEMIDGLGTHSPRRRRKDRHSPQGNAELAQILQLSLSETAPSKAEPKPLFDTPFSPKSPSPKPKKRIDTPPVFAKVSYTDADFQALLNNDEPYIPAIRYRKREPSSTLSIKEREQGLSENDVATTKSAKSEKTVKAKTKTTKANGDKITKTTNAPNGEKADKPKKRKKSNAKPRASSDD